MHKNLLLGAAFALLLNVSATLNVAAQNTFPTSGDAGIGTLSPEGSLDIITSDYLPARSIVGHSYDNTNKSSLQIINSDAPQIGPGSVPLGVTYHPGNNSDIFSIWRKSHNNSYSNKKLFSVSGDGKVRIGEQAATGAYANYKLSVDGDIITRRLVVQIANWADFVFAPDYELLPLHKVEEFVTANKHLPGVPTEKEVLEQGIEVGEMNKILLQKVEELTLYVIELEKKYKELEQKVAD